MKKITHQPQKHNQDPASSKSRKELRKQKKMQKKERKKHFFEAKTHNNQTSNSGPRPKAQPKPLKRVAVNVSKVGLGKEQKDQQKRYVGKTQPITKPKKAEKSQKKVQEQTQDDKMIEYYEQKLGMGQGKDKYNKIAKNFDFDDDIFDFLDGISKKVQQGYKYDQPPEQNDQDLEQQGSDEQEDQQENFQEEEEEEVPQKPINKHDSLIVEDWDARDDQQIYQSPNIDEFDRQYDEMFDNLDQVERDSEEDEQLIQQQPVSSKNKKIKASPASRVKLNLAPAEDNSIGNRTQSQQIRRSMNRLLNKLSDGNVLFTFREFLKIIESYPKSSTIPVYAQVFIKFNLMIEKPLFHILATNVALLVALHYAVGNRLMAPVLYELTQKYLSVDNQEENQMEVQQLGYSKKFERLKNYATIVSLCYNYKSISGQYIESYVTWLTKSLNKSNIELIYIIIQKSGIKIRQNDPSVLKNIINTIKTAIDTYKERCNNDEEQMQKIKFIQLEINQIRFNKKEQTNTDQRMAFLETFIQKNVQKEIQKEKQIFLLDFETLMNADTSRTLWWEHQLTEGGLVEQRAENMQEEINLEMSKQKRQLLQLAKSFHMVTETKKNIFLCLMDSKDYLQATQRILELNVKHQQDIATVLVQVCTLQPNFNPYYPLVAAKIASLMPKFRMNLQYAIWDHLKLIQQYELRRTSNLAKFTAKLISNPIANCSLSILKFYPDLSNVKAIDTTFLNICFTFFFKKVKKDYLSKLVGKLRQQNNRDIKYGIQEFLSDFDCPEELKEKVKICRRLLRIELDERKAEMNDDDF